VQSALIALLCTVESSGVRCLFLFIVIVIITIIIEVFVNEKVFTWFLEPTDYCIIQKPCKLVFVILKVIRLPRSGICTCMYLTFSEVVAVDV
jgi:hypothetical protein